MNEITVVPAVVMTILGVVAPFVIQLVTQWVVNERIRFLIALAAAAITGVVAMLIAGISLSMTPEILGLWFAWTSFLFKMVWKPLWKKNGSILNAPATTYK